MEIQLEIRGKLEREDEAEIALLVSLFFLYSLHSFFYSLLPRLTAAPKFTRLEGKATLSDVVSHVFRGVGWLGGSRSKSSESTAAADERVRIVGKG